MPSAVPHSTVARRAGVAVRVHPRRHDAELLQQVGPPARQPAVGLDVLLRHRHRLGDDGRRPVVQSLQHAVDGPRQVDRRRSGPADPLGLGPHVVGSEAVAFGPLSAAIATPNAPATPIAGAPRTASRRMASIIVSTSRTSSQVTSSGRSVWSTSTAWSPRHSIVRIGPGS